MHVGQPLTRMGEIRREATNYIDVTDLTSGKYRLCATADLAGQFTEASAANNTTWVDLELQLSTKG